MELSIIVAAAENDVIGKSNRLIWRLSADLKRFKMLTAGHTVLMGRKTFESIGKALPGRRNVVISRDTSFVASGCETVASIEEAMALVKGDDEVFIIGGGTIYNLFWNKADKLYLTRVHVRVEGDTFIPSIDVRQWREVKKEEFKADEKNEYGYSFIDYICAKD